MEKVKEKEEEEAEVKAKAKVKSESNTASGELKTEYFIPFGPGMVKKDKDCRGLGSETVGFLEGES